MAKIEPEIKQFHFGGSRDVKKMMAVFWVEKFANTLE